MASVQVDFNAVEPGRPDTVQNDGISGRERKGNRDSGDLADILIGKKNFAINVIKDQIVKIQTSFSK